MRMEFDRAGGLADYEIAAHLDSGGMADVFLAYPRAAALDSPLVVIKVLRQRYRDEPEVAAMFRDEARIMTRLAHPNVVQVLDCGEADDRPYLVLEYLDGDHLGVLAREARRQDRPLAISLLTRIFIQVANALDYIHNAGDTAGRPLGLVHRDISPQNVFVTYDGRIKILDFGIALAVDRSAATRTGMLKGKLRYMSPEQIQALPVDGRSDLFSAGVVLWELLSGKRLFQADSEFATMKLICEAPIPSPDALREDMPVTFEAIVMGLLRRPLDERTPDAATLRGELLGFLRAECPDSPPDEIVRAAADLLGARQRQKHSHIESLQVSRQLRSYLFADLDAGDEQSDTGADRERPSPAAPPARFQPAAAATDAPQPAAAAAGAAPAAAPGAANRGGMPGWLAALLVVLLLAGAGGGTLVLLWPADADEEASAMAGKPAGLGVADGLVADGSVADEPVADESVVDGSVADEPVADGSVADEPVADESAADGSVVDESAVDESVADESAADGSAVDGSVADESVAGEGEAMRDAVQAVEPEIGFLMVKTSPQTAVYLGDRYLGRSPVEDMKLEPGSYRVRMVDETRGIEKSETVTIRPGEVSSIQYIF
jgi:serine/threonine protein kinase